MGAGDLDQLQVAATGNDPERLTAIGEALGELGEIEIETVESLAGWVSRNFEEGSYWRGESLGGSAEQGKVRVLA